MDARRLALLRPQADSKEQCITGDPYPLFDQFQFIDYLLSDGMLSLMRASHSITYCDIIPTRITRNFTDAMDQAETRLQTFNIYYTSRSIEEQLDALQTSNQRHHIHTLKITSSDRLHQRPRAFFDGLAAIFAERLHNFGSLTNLTLYGNHNTISLTALHSCLCNLRHLQTIVLNNVYTYSTKRRRPRYRTMRYCLYPCNQDQNSKWR